MKKVLSLIFAAAVLAACGDGSRSDREAEARNDDDNIEENSGENISPQLKDSADRFDVDSISSAGDARHEMEDEEENNDEAPRQ